MVNKMTLAAVVVVEMVMPLSTHLAIHVAAVAVVHVVEMVPKKHLAIASS